MTLRNTSRYFSLASVFLDRLLRWIGEVNQYARMQNFQLWQEVQLSARTELEVHEARCKSRAQMRHDSGGPVMDITPVAFQIPGSLYNELVRRGFVQSEEMGNNPEWLKDHLSEIDGQDYWLLSNADLPGAPRIRVMHKKNRQRPFMFFTTER